MRLQVGFFKAENEEAIRKALTDYAEKQYESNKEIWDSKVFTIVEWMKVWCLLI